jgi:hypothetical protein
MSSNICKIQLHSLSRFSITAKRCQSKFEFSFKIYKSKLLSCFAKVVDLLSLRPTELGLHFSEFSMSFYDSSKVLDQLAKELR